MSRELDAVLQAGSEQVASATAPRPAHLVRARGDQRQRRRTAACAMLAVAVVAGVAAAAAAGHGHRPAPVTRTRSSLDLIAPSRYAPGVPNPVSFTIRNPRRARTVMVDVSLSRPHTIVYRKATVERFDQATGNWVAVPVVFRSSGWSASYSLHVRPGDTAQRLLIVPAVPTTTFISPPETLAVRVLSGIRVLAQQQAPAAKLEPLRADLSSGPDSITPGQTGDYKLTVANPAGIGYPVRVVFMAAMCGSKCDSLPAGTEIQWLDGTTWRTFDPSAYQSPGHGQLMETVTMPAGGKLTVRIRFVTSRDTPKSIGTMGFELTPDRAVFPGPARWYPPVGSDSNSSLVEVS